MAFVRVMLHLIGVVLRCPACGFQRIGRSADIGIGVQRIESFERDMHGSIDRRSRSREDADDLERLILVQRELDFARTMRDHDALSQPITERLRDLGAEHCIVRRLETFPGRDFQRSIARKAVMLEIIARRAEHAEAMMRIAERKRNRPRDFRPRRDGSIGFPADVVRRIADPKNGKQQEMDGTAACTDDQVGSGDRAGKALACLFADAFDAEQERRGERDRHDRQCGREAAIAKALDGERGDHSRTPAESGFSRAIRLHSDSSTLRSNSGASEAS